MTITLSPDIERVLTEEAARRQKTPDELAEEVLRAHFPVPMGHVGPRGEELRAQVNAARGMFAPEDLTPERSEERRQEALARIHSGYFQERLSSSEEFSARKEEEKALEERRWHK